MKPGQVICFNNRRILHGRNEFVLNGGVRHLQGYYDKIFN
jgi:alpha-ketoglutarate-dependent taurine dioxygenase